MAAYGVQKLALDTNAYRALGDGNQLLATCMQSAVSLGLPIIVLGELYDGFFNGNKTAQNLATLQKFLDSPRLEILQINEQTARLFGEIATQLRRDGRSIQQDDIWIAALCKQYGYTLATKDSGFGYVTGLDLVGF